IHDDTLTGTPGTRAVEVSADRSATIVGGEQVLEPAIPGEDVATTLDRDIQFKAQELLESTVERFDADLGMAIVTRIDDGAVLAAVGALADDETGAVRCTSNNLPFTHTFEPGSTMKIVSVAAALESGAVYPHTPIDVPAAKPYPVDDGDIFHVRDTGRSDDRVYSTSEILIRSSNVGSSTLAEIAGSDAVWGLMHDFGFGSVSGVDFPGESGGILDPFLSTVALPIASYGQGVSVTAAQVIESFNTVANGGVRVPLSLTSAELGTKPGEQVIGEQTSDLLMDMMQGVVEHENGTGPNAAVRGYTVAGKTSTAWQPCDGSVGYDCPEDDPDGRDHHYTAGFAGIISNDQGPQFSVYVMIDNPRNARFGNDVAAPVFAEIAAYAARQLQIPQAASGVTTTAVRAETAATTTTTLAPESQDG
ncbi:MAG: penicillin-binding transpeptidase domain-containing protein, partial [Actinomycetota bacterium]